MVSMDEDILQTMSGFFAQQGISVSTSVTVISSLREFS